MCGNPPARHDKGAQYCQENGIALQAMRPEDVDSLVGRELVFKLGGNEIPFTAENFILSFSLPNFYFHATTAYAILRSRGVPLGKRDFIGRMKIGG